MEVPESGTSLLDLVRRAKDKDKQAFEEIFRRYERRIYNLIYQMLGDPDDAADLTQDVFVRIHSGLSELRTDEAFNSWIYQVAVNLGRDHIRRYRRVRVDSIEQGGRATEDDDTTGIEIPDWSENPEQKLEQAEMEQAVRRAVAALPEHYRTVVILHHLHGMEVTDIAKAVGCQIGTVKSRLSRGRDELKRRLEAYIRGRR